MKNNVYKLTRTYVFKNFLKLSLIIVLIVFLELGIAFINGEMNQTVRVVKELLENPNADADSLIAMMSSGQSFIWIFTKNTLTRFLESLALITILKTYRNHKKFSFRIFWESLLSKPFTILLGCLMLSLIDFILQLIPLVGPLLAIVFKYASYFALILLFEKDAIEPIEAIMQSIQLTKGHKWALFKIQVRYGILFVVGVLISLIILLLSPTYNFVFLIAYLLLQLVYSLFALTVSSVYYAENLGVKEAIFEG